VNVLNNDLVKTMGEKPTLETVGQAQLLLVQQSPLIKEKIRELRDAGRLRKNSDERIQMDEFIVKNTDKIADYYENFADVAQADLENLNNLKDQYINAKLSATDSGNLRKDILQKNNLLKENVDVIKAMNVLMAGLESIYKEVEKEDEGEMVEQFEMKNEKIEINSDNGAVTLTGTVSETSQRPMAQHIAEALPGVRGVDNQILVAGEPIAEDSDVWIRSKVKAMLLFHRNVSASKTEVNVANGVVTLRGEAINSAQKDLTTEYAKDVQGVKDVTNEMTIAAAPVAPDATVTTTTTESTLDSVTDLIDDASITAQVRMSLLLHRSTSAMSTKVGTKDGVVTLGGEAKNSAEIDLVTKLVNDIHGVKLVINNMTVEKAVSKSD